MSLKGIDISHHNKYQLASGQLVLSKHDFIIVKASEGKSFKDPMFNEYMKAIRNLNKPHGIYHYARPEFNTPLTEANFFHEAIKHEGDDSILILDWEGKATTYPIEWAIEWLKIVENIYGKKPMIYCSSWYTKKLKPVLENGNGLWVAHYGVKKPKVYTYPFYAIWQYSSDPYDKDIFNGNLSQWLKYT